MEAASRKKSIAAIDEEEKSFSPDDYGRTADEIFDELGWGWFQIRLFIIVGLSFACDVMEIQLLTFIQGCVKAEWGLSSEIEALLTGMVFLGQIIGMLTLGPLADIYGRRISILLGWFLIVVFGLVSCLSTDITMLIITRMFVGVGIGSSQSVAYDLFAETVPTMYRNRIVYISLFSVFGSEYVIGVAAGSLVEYGWRYTTFFCALPILTLGIIGYFCLPESPRWLISQGRMEEAEALFKEIAIMNEADDQCGPIVARPITEPSDKTLSDLVSGPLLPRSMMIWGVWTLGYFALICLNLVLIDSYSIGECDFMFDYLALANGVEFFGILLAIQILSCAGRVGMQFSLYILSAVLLFIYATVFTYSGQVDAALSMLFLAKVALPAAIAITWVHTVELFPTELRASGHSLAAIMGRIGSFAAVYWVDDYVVDDGHTLTGSLFYIGAAVVTAFLVLQLPETAGIRLDDTSAVTPSEQDDRVGGAKTTVDDGDDSDAMNVLAGGEGLSGEEQSLLGKGKKPQNFPFGFR